MASLAGSWVLLLLFGVCVHFAEKRRTRKKEKAREERQNVFEATANFYEYDLKRLPPPVPSAADGDTQEGVALDAKGEPLSLRGLAALRPVRLAGARRRRPRRGAPAAPAACSGCGSRAAASAEAKTRRRASAACRKWRRRGRSARRRARARAAALASGPPVRFVQYAQRGALGASEHSAQAKLSACSLVLCVPHFDGVLATTPRAHVELDDDGEPLPTDPVASGGARREAPARLPLGDPRPPQRCASGDKSPRVELLEDVLVCDHTSTSPDDARPISADAARDDGSSPLLLACERGHADVVALLLRKGAAAGRPSLSGRTPVMAAAYHGHLSCLEPLLAAGASAYDGTTRDAKGQPRSTIELAFERVMTHDDDACTRRLLAADARLRLPRPSSTNTPPPTAAPPRRRARRRRRTTRAR